MSEQDTIAAMEALEAQNTAKAREEQMAAADRTAGYDFCGRLYYNDFEQVQLCF